MTATLISRKQIRFRREQLFHLPCSPNLVIHHLVCPHRRLKRRSGHLLVLVIPSKAPCKETEGTKKVRQVLGVITSRRRHQQPELIRMFPVRGTSIQSKSQHFLVSHPILMRLDPLSPQTQNIIFDVSQSQEDIQATRDAVKSTAIALVKQDSVFLPGTTIGATHWVAYAMTRGLSLHNLVYPYSSLNHISLIRSRSSHLEIKWRSYITPIALNVCKHVQRH